MGNHEEAAAIGVAHLQFHLDIGDRECPFLSNRFKAMAQWNWRNADERSVLLCNRSQGEATTKGPSTDLQNR